ncbi:MAG: tetratricopeptide repeat protein, partial [Gammaproteobacteria bacterium]|nr:tetratricopeptide repeat protein [Gammaproteobacteria bacterium]
RELFTNPLWRGIAEYRTGDFHAALKSFSQLDSAQAHYNRGNTLMHLGRTEEAIAAYRQTLKLEPGHGDAGFNLELAQRRTQQQPAPTQDAAARPADQQKPPRLQDNPKSQYAEDLLDTPNPEELSQESGEAPEDLDKIGHMGGGAMLIPGAEQPQGPESPGIGQGLDDGTKMERESDHIARESRQAGETRSEGETTTETTENRFADPARPEVETRDVESTSEPAERPSTALAQNSDSATPEPEQDQQGSGDRQRKGAQDSATPPPNLPAESTPADRMNLEGAQAVQQWLDRIPEGQSGLLKEKFLREYRRHPGPGYGGDPW